MGLRARQVVALTLLAAFVALLTTLLSAAALARTAVTMTQSRAELLAETLHHLARRATRDAGADDTGRALASNEALRDYAQAVVGYSPLTLYLAITDDRGKAVFHSDPTQEGKRLVPVESIAEFARRPGLAQLWVLTRSHRTLAVDLPFSPDGRTRFGYVRVALSTLFLRRELETAVARNASVAAVLVMAVFLASFYLAGRILAPIDRLRRELGKIEVDSGPPLDLHSVADVDRLTEFFSTMSRKLAQARQPPEGEAVWLETMVDGLADGVIVASATGKIISLNAAASEWFERDRHELTGRSLDEVLPRSHPLRELVDDALAAGGAIGPREVRLSVAGREVPHSLTAQNLREEGSVTGVMVTGRDLEKLARLGSHLSYTQKLAALGQLTSGVAHEIRNPLNALTLHTALLREKTGTVPEAVPHLQVVEGEIRRLGRVLEGFLKFTRPDSLRLEAISVADALEEVLAPISEMAVRDGIRIETRIPDGLPPVNGDRELLTQAFHNLVRNACEAMPGAGTLRIVAERDGGGQILVVIEDTGLGIAKESLPRIFDLFYTTKSEGSGIGLSLVYRIVQLHGGEISVDSEPGRGSRFEIRLPEALG